MTRAHNGRRLIEHRTFHDGQRAVPVGLPETGFARAFLAAELVGEHWKLKFPWAYTYGDANFLLGSLDLRPVNCQLRSLVAGRLVPVRAS